MSRKRRMQYKGESQDVTYNPWMRLVHGRHYDVEKTKTHSGKIRVRISDEMETGRIMYKNDKEFEKDWC